MIRDFYTSRSRSFGHALFVLALCFAVVVLAKASDKWTDPSPHTVKFVTLDKNVQLEVLDWGGRGRPLVLLAGFGNTAHVFDNFAPHLTDKYHVYGITRRGFGASAYSGLDVGIERLTDDIMAVLDSLKLRKPILVGHSFAGAELSEIAERDPHRVAGLVYLDAAYLNAFDNGKGPTLKDFQTAPAPRVPQPSNDDLANFAAFTKWHERVLGRPYPESELRQILETDAGGKPGNRLFPPSATKMVSVTRKFTTIAVPALMIFAAPHTPGPWIDSSPDPAVAEATRAFEAADLRRTEMQIKAVQDALPTVKIVKISSADSFIFLSREKEVLRALRPFLKRL